MATKEEEVVLVFLVFMVMFLMFPICRACMRQTLDLLESTMGARYFPIVVVYSWMRCFPHGYTYYSNANNNTFMQITKQMTKLYGNYIHFFYQTKYQDTTYSWPQVLTTIYVKTTPYQHGYYRALAAPKDTIAMLGSNQTYYASLATHITTLHQNSQYNSYNLHTIKTNSSQQPPIGKHQNINHTSTTSHY